MSQRAALSGPGRRRARTRRVGPGKLAGIAVAIAAVTMAGLTASAVATRASCSNSPDLLNVAASADVAPAVQTVARAFNNQHVISGGNCVEVQVTSGDPAVQTEQIDGQRPPQGAPVDAWIPDSTLWVDTARTFPVGAQAVQPTGQNVARSPLLLVTTEAVANRTHIFDAPAGWNMLLPAGYGGPPASLSLGVDLPDPASTAAGLAALIEVDRELGTGANARTALTQFALQANPRSNFDAPQALAQFTGAFGLKSNSITVASEQAVLAYDKASPKAPLVARYPTGVSAALGSPELDYPFVVTTSKAAQVRAARLFGNYLQSGYAQAVVRYQGFRSADGKPDKMPASAGLATQPLQLATRPTPQTAAADLQNWQRLALGYRELILADVSPAMSAPTGVGNQTLEQLLTGTASKGLGLLPPSAQLGLWEMGQPGESVAQPYKELVSIGPLGGPLGVLTREAQFQQISATLRVSPAGVLALNSAILAAYKYMTAHYVAGYDNLLVVATTAVDTARGDISDSELLTQLEHLYNSSKRVAIVPIMFGSKGDFKGMQAIAKATGGGAYLVTDPSQIGAILVSAVSHRICNQNC